MRVGENGTVHWKEGILWLELLVMVLAGFMPQKWNSLVNCLIGFSCAMQVEAFRKMHGHGLCHDHVYRKFKKREPSFWPWELLKTTASRGSTDYGITGSTWYLWPVRPASALLCQVLAERAVWVCAAALLSAILSSGITADG